MHKAIEKRKERIKSIEDEFDEPLVDIVSGFRDMKYSYFDIAGALEIPYPTFIKWQRKLGLTDGKINWRNGERSNSLNVKARKLGYDGASQLISTLRYQKKTRQQVADLLGCHKHSLWRHTPQDCKYLSFTTALQKRVRRELMEKINERRRIETMKRNRDRE